MYKRAVLALFAIQTKKKIGKTETSRCQPISYINLAPVQISILYFYNYFFLLYRMSSCTLSTKIKLYSANVLVLDLFCPLVNRTDNIFIHDLYTIYIVNRQGSCGSLALREWLALSQTTNSRLVQTERVCRRQF